MNCARLYVYLFLLPLTLLLVFFLSAFLFDLPLTFNSLRHLPTAVDQAGGRTFFDRESPEAGEG